MIKKLLCLLVLLLTATTGAWAQDPTYAVKMANATDAEAVNWTIASGDKSVKGNVADGLTGLSEGAEVTVTYTGRMKVKSVTATSDAQPAEGHALAKSAVGELVGSDGKGLSVDK